MESMEEKESLKRKNEAVAENDNVNESVIGNENEQPKESIVSSKKKRGKKSHTPTIPVPISVPLSAKIGLQPLAANDQSSTSSDDLNLGILSLNPSMFSPFDFFMLPFASLPKDNEQLLPGLVATEPLLTKISEILGSMSIQQDAERDWISSSFFCVPSSSTKKQHNVILVLESPTPICPTPLVDFSSFVLQVVERFEQIAGVEVVLKVSAETDNSLESEWAIWNAVNRDCRYHQKLSVALEIKSLRPSFTGLCNRWKGEKLKMILFPDTFIPSLNKFPTEVKNVLSHFSNFAKHFVVQTRLPKESADNASIYDFPKLYKYLSMRIVNNTKLYGIEANFLAPYTDKLQIPLQPLEEDLTPEVYNVFEKCPVKYRRYQEAIYLALRARVMVVGSPIIVMVVGAGRGPLVLQTIVASQRARRPVKIYALDKNPHAIKALQELQRKKQWEDDEVVIVDADMRTWNPPEKADILVSELLGSFGDNELSPECLDAAQRFLNKDGISIPQQYTSFLAPVSSSTLFHEVLGIIQRARVAASTSTTTQTNNNSTTPLPSTLMNGSNTTIESPAITVSNNPTTAAEETNFLYASHELEQKIKEDEMETVGSDNTPTSISPPLDLPSSPQNVIPYQHSDSLTHFSNGNSVDDHSPSLLPSPFAPPTTNQPVENLLHSLTHLPTVSTFNQVNSNQNLFQQSEPVNFDITLETASSPYTPIAVSPPLDNPSSPPNILADPISNTTPSKVGEPAFQSLSLRRKKNRNRIPNSGNTNGMKTDGNRTNGSNGITAQIRRLYEIPPEYYYEIGYVVKFHNVNFLDDPHRCFSFSHPNPEEPINNNRHTKILFHPKMDGVLHGFAGFFETLLYDKISFSTNPPNNDHNLVAWFPMFFPLKEPIMVLKDIPLEVNFWRKCSNTQVWYEWCLGNPEDPATFIHNTGGRAYSMNL